VLRLGSVVLTAVLLGVPRALDARAFGSARSVYVEVADPWPELTGFADELSRALERAGCRVATGPTGATTVVEVHALWRCADLGPGPSEAISFTVRDARGRRPLVLDYAAGREADAARALLAALDGPPQLPALRATA
jgi:hypothetical protein